MSEKKECRAYLAGAIEKAPDGGKKWRRDISKFLEGELNHSVWDPTIEEYHVMTDEEKENFRRWKTDDFAKFRGVVRKIIDKDLHCLLKESDYAIALWDEHVLGGGGTHGEITLCYYHNVPLYMVINMPLSEVSSWIAGCATEIFEDFDSLKDFLRKKYLIR